MPGGEWGPVVRLNPPELRVRERARRTGGNGGDNRTLAPDEVPAPIGSSSSLAPRPRPTVSPATLCSSRNVVRRTRRGDVRPSTGEA